MFSSITLLIAVPCICAVVWGIVYACVSHRNAQKRLKSAYQYAKGATNSLLYCQLAEPDKVVNCNGEKQKISEDVNHRVSFCKLSSESHVPSKAYAVAFDSVSIDTKGNALCFTFRPETDVCRDWMVTAISKESITCEHPVMGEIVLQILPPMFLSVGNTIELYQFAALIGDEYHLEYTL